MGMYKKDKSVRFNVRITEEQACFIEQMTKNYNCSASDAFRIIIDSYLWGTIDCENEQANIDNQL